MNNTREVAEGIQYQGTDEIILYALTVTNWITTLSAATGVKVYDVTEGRTDVTATVMPITTMTVNANRIAFSPLKLLTPGRVYRVEVLFTGDGQAPEAYFIVQAEY
jgi:hypothetical protein